MTRFFLASTVLLTCTAAVSPAAASGPLKVTHVIETDDAVWFSTSERSDVVFYYPRTETVLSESSPPSGRRRFLVQEKLRSISIPTDLAELHGSWTGRFPVPHTLTPQESCTLDSKPEMILVQQQSDMAGRSFPGNTQVALCQFSFNLERDVGEPYVQDLYTQAQTGTLIVAPLAIDMAVSGTLQWADLHASVAEAGAPATAVAKNVAVLFIAWGICANPDDTAAYLDLSAEERAAFLDQALALLFTTDEEAYLFTDTPPEGEFEGWGESSKSIAL
jgi:hypothetical protein